ncbi:unnamed protein product, partial [Candidula unifasciata]
MQCASWLFHNWWSATVGIPFANNFEVCAGREAGGCHPEVNNTCIYCCSDPTVCQLQKDDLFTYELPSLGLPTNIL